MKVCMTDVDDQEVKNLRLMADYQSVCTSKTCEVVVRGAIVYCEAGSHYRYLNIPIKHGADVAGRSVVLESDCIFGKNISNFGICAIKTKAANTTDNFINASEIPGTLKGGGVLRGLSCALESTGGWLNVDSNSLSYNQISFKNEGEVMEDSLIVCAVGKPVKAMWGGQVVVALFGSDQDTLADHDLCKFSPKINDPIQINISKNKITIDIYIEFINANKEKKKWIKKGIEKWSDRYTYIFGHKGKIVVDLHENKEKWGENQNKITYQCVPEEECQKKEEDVRDNIETDKNGVVKRSHLVETISAFDYSADRTIMMYPIEAMNTYTDLGALIPRTDKNGEAIHPIQPIVNVREVTETEYKNIVAHELGHAMGLSEAYIEIANETCDLRKVPKNGVPAIKWNDVMLTAAYRMPITISPINIQMIIAAAKERKIQFYSTYLVEDVNAEVVQRTISKGADMSGIFDECENKKTE